ncbi:MAG TPA: hypothetical protein VMN78_00775 [Longimicrobiales bacterium]|nr:hypothetical protein [Longimicrobiales bacterium]
MGGVSDARLRADILRVLDTGVDMPLEDDAFDRLARRVFAHQLETNSHYALYCRRRGRTVETVAHWSEIPPVPTAAFKAVDLVSGDGTRAEAVFRTSGTTRGAETRGRHIILDLELYRRALLPNLRAHLLPDDASLPFLCLVPPAAHQPDSSLACMIDVAARRLGGGEPQWFVDPERGLDAERLARALETHERDGRPVALLGTTLAFVHLLDWLGRAGRAFALPRGSRLMDTGGFKGSGRDVESAELLDDYRALLGIEPDHRVNEYGMTEMCSQFYGTVLRDVTAGRPPVDGHSVPPWVRTRAVDPDTLAPVAPGNVGILQHFDLANLGSVVAVQTEDLGVVDGTRFTLLGRSPGAQPRGCSIAMDILLQDRTAPVR